MWRFACLFVIIGISYFHVHAEPIVSIDEATVTVRENDSGNVTCTVINSTSMDDQVVAWFNEDNTILTDSVTADVYQVFLGYDNSSINETFRVQIFFNIPAMANDFEMRYTCKLTNDSLNTPNTTSQLKVQIYVPLVLTNASEPVTLCMNDPTVLSCGFRSNPKPYNVRWNVTDDGNVVILNTNENQTTELAVQNVRTTTAYTCEAHSTNFDGISESANKSITVTVRDDQVPSVTHQTLNSTLCEVKWNATNITYRTGYQIRIEDDSEILVAYINDANTTTFTWEMKKGDVLNIAVAMKMSSCTGPYTVSNGNCTYEQPIIPTAAPVPQDNTAVIVVGTVLGVAVAVLAVLLGFVCYKSRRNQSMSKARIQEMQRRQKSRPNAYEPSPGMRRSEPQQMNRPDQRAQGHTNLVAEDDNIYADTIGDDTTRDDTMGDGTYQDVEVQNSNAGHLPPPRTTSLDTDDHYEVPMANQQDMRMQGMGPGGAYRPGGNPRGY